MECVVMGPSGAIAPQSVEGTLAFVVVVVVVVVIVVVRIFDYDNDNDNDNDSENEQSHPSRWLRLSGLGSKQDPFASAVRRLWAERCRIRWSQVLLRPKAPGT